MKTVKKHTRIKQADSNKINTTNYITYYYSCQCDIIILFLHNCVDLTAVHLNPLI